MSEDLDINDEVLEFLRVGEFGDDEQYEDSVGSTNGTFTQRSDVIVSEVIEDILEDQQALCPVTDPEQFWRFFSGTSLEGAISVLDLILHFTLNSYPLWIRKGIRAPLSTFSETVPLRALFHKNIVVLKFSFSDQIGLFDLSFGGRCNGGVIFGKHQINLHLWTLRVDLDRPGYLECESMYGTRHIPHLDYIFENIIVCYKDLKRKRNYLAACLVAVERDQPFKRTLLCNRLWAIFPGLWGQVEVVGKMVRFYQVQTDDYYKHTFSEDGWIEDPGCSGTLQIVGV